MTKLIKVQFARINTVLNRVSSHLWNTTRQMAETKTPVSPEQSLVTNSFGGRIVVGNMDKERQQLKEMAGGVDPLSMSPEEFAVRYGYQYGCYGVHVFCRFEDANFNAWIQRFGTVLTDAKLFDKFCLLYLTPEEIEHVRNFDPS